jgi:hypothetical protein
VSAHSKATGEYWAQLSRSERIALGKGIVTERLEGLGCTVKAPSSLIDGKLAVRRTWRPRTSSPAGAVTLHLVAVGIVRIREELALLSPPDGSGAVNGWVIDNHERSRGNTTVLRCI